MINYLVGCSFVIIALLSWFIWDKRYRINHGTEVPKGYILTTEVFIDPVSGNELKVYYDPKTGERFYHQA
ncbi:MAG: hypothetical protein ABFD04_14815 [Syntrophomonas sp.]